MDARWSRMWDLFHACLERDARDRAAYLAAACPDDAGLRREVERLLETNDGAARFLSESPSLVEGSSGEPTADAIPGYRIRGVIGEGGMGVVYDAEQQEPVRRRVAIKLIKPGMDSHEVVRRFESERQALALMNHPNIAMVFDGGTSPDGRPFFVMEHVAGLPLLDYCDKRRLTTRDRLELFVAICDAIQHAHQKGVVHRDLKPTNILVNDQDDGAQPKVIDFGVAKALDQRLSSSSVFTELGQMIGTVEYMSPEQAEMSGLDVDTRADVYSLGVILYQLLVGALPFDSDRFRKRGLVELQRLILEAEPPRPSTRLSMPDTDGARIAGARGTELPRLVRQIQGELDWIVGRAMEKDRTRRYGTASELAADVRRYLQGEPVVAGPPSLTYRARKFIERHKLGAAAAAVVVVGLGVGLGGVTLGLFEANRARTRAEQVNEFLKQIISSIDPDVARGRDTSLLREMLDDVSQRIDPDLRSQPEVAAELHVTLAEAYQRIGEIDQGEAHARSAVRLGNTLGHTHPLTLQGLNELTLALLELNRLDEADPVSADNVERHLARYGSDALATLSAMNNRALVLRALGRYEEVERIHRTVLDVRTRTLGRSHEKTLITMNNLANVLRDRGSIEEGATLMGEVVELRTRLSGRDDMETLAAIDNLGRMFAEQGRLDEAERLHREAMEGFLKRASPTHTDTLAARYFLSRVLLDQGRLDEAEELLSGTLATLEEVFSRSHRGALLVAMELADCLRRLRRLEEARRLFLQVANDAKGVYDDAGHDMHARIGARYAHCLVDLGDLDDARDVLNAALPVLERAFGPTGRDTRMAYRAALALHESAGEAERAEEYRVRLSADIPG